MALLGIDLGGTKLELAIFTEEGNILLKDIIKIGKREGKEIGSLITDVICKFLDSYLLEEAEIKSVGICIPGIYRSREGTVWAPNIPGWDNYPLLQEVKTVIGEIPVTIDSDRACYILGEVWKGNARGCRDAVFLAVGTGIGAGIMVDGVVLRGAHDIAGAVGWLALDRPFKNEYISCGCFEHHASGEGIAKVARKYLTEQKEYTGELRDVPIEKISSFDVFEAYNNEDTLAIRVLLQSVEFWGMAVANLVSLFNPEKIIFGGGVFGPGTSFLPAIGKEAARWAQPISIKQVSIVSSSLGGDAGIYGAGFLALQQCTSI